MPVLGVDPDARMAGLARQSGIDVEVAKFEAWDPGDRLFDAVYREVMPDAPGNFWVKPMLDVYTPGFTRASAGIREARAFGDPE